MPLKKRRNEYDLATNLLLNISKDGMTWSKAIEVIETLVSERIEELNADTFSRYNEIQSKRLHDAWSRVRKG